MKRTRADIQIELYEVRAHLLDLRITARNLADAAQAIYDQHHDQPGFHGLDSYVKRVREQLERKRTP